MSNSIIKVENLGKKYKIRHHQEQQRYIALRDVIAEKAAAPLRWLSAQSGKRQAQSVSNNNGASAAPHASPLPLSSSQPGSNASPLPLSPLQREEEFWALKDVSFEVKQGEVLGIIGRNGAGKSTLLKILSQITEPTEGRVRLRGRVASLLEVGTGFHPELTGRENIYLNGAILGMTRAEIKCRFDEIVAFAELEKFLDTPVKRYSSGMYVRLAFAVAAHLDPEILLIDEVLAVGDAQFQRKCLKRMTKVVGQGRTILFVSHNLLAVQNICHAVVWIGQGKLIGYGNAPEIISQYSAQSTSTQVKNIWPDKETAPGNEAVRLYQAAAYANDTNDGASLTVQSSVVLEFKYWNLVSAQHLNLSLVLWNEEGIPVFNTFPNDERGWHGRPFTTGLFRSRCIIPSNLLNSGIYRVQLYVVRDQSQIIYSIDDILTFEVADVREPSIAWYGRWIGAVRPKLRWETDKIESSQGILSTQSS